MRILGIPEKYITGDASDYEKFEKWYECLPRLAGNALFDWSVMEFDKVFGMELYPFRKSAELVSLVEDLSLFDKEKGICPSLRGDDIVGVNISYVKKLEQLTELTNSNEYKLYSFTPLVDGCGMIGRTDKFIVPATYRVNSHGGYELIAD